MSSRRNLPPEYDKHITRAHGVVQDDSLPWLSHSVEQLPLVVFENKLASQAAEIKQLFGDNHKLACSHISLRQDLVAAHRDVEKLKEHIRSIQTESDIQIRILLDKIGKMEEDIRSGENIKNELQEAHLEAQCLVKSRLELDTLIQDASMELDDARADIETILHMSAELQKLKQEHQRLRKDFDQQKDMNTEKVEGMKIMEEELVRIAEEVQRLQTEIPKAENRASAPIPCDIAHSNNSDYGYPPTYHVNGGYMDNYGMSFPHMVGVEGEGTNQVSASRFAVYAPVVNSPVVSGAGVPTWGATYDGSHVQR